MDDESVGRMVVMASGTTIWPGFIMDVDHLDEKSTLYGMVLILQRTVSFP
jgi:hypothetical protein